MSFISVTGNLDNQLNMSSKTSVFFSSLCCSIFSVILMLATLNGSNMTVCESVLVFFFYIYVIGMKKRKEKWTKEL